MVMSKTEVAIAMLIDGDGICTPIQIVPAYDEDDCAFIPLCEGIPPVLTVGCTGADSLRALYHETGPNDFRHVPAVWETGEGGDYAVITVPEGVVRVPASCLRG